MSIITRAVVESKTFHKLLAKRWMQRLMSRMPLDLFLVRHGESEANVIHGRVKAGEVDEAELERFGKIHNSRAKLTDEGRKQAKAAGMWFVKEYGNHPLVKDGDGKLRFDRFFHRHIWSTHARAAQTACLMAEEMGFDDKEVWYADPCQSERCWGKWNYFDPKDVEGYRLLRERMKTDPLFVAPENGESLIQMGDRACYRLYDTLCRELTLGKALDVCHGEVMWMNRFFLERMTLEQFHDLENSDDPKDKIHNAQIIHYSRANPETGVISPAFSHMRMIVPWDESLNTPWREIERKKHSAKETLQRIDAAA